MNTPQRHSLRVLLAGAGLLLAGCSTWQAEFLRATRLYPAFPEREQLVGRYSVFALEDLTSDDRKEFDDDLGGVKLLSDGSYYDATFFPETGQVFIVDSGRWQYRDGHLYLERDHRALDKTGVATRPEYVVAATSHRPAALLRLLPTSVGTFQGEQLFLQGRPAKGNFFPDKIREHSGTIFQSSRGFRDEVSEKRQLEEDLRTSNEGTKHYRAEHPSHEETR